MPFSHAWTLRVGIAALLLACVSCGSDGDPAGIQSSDPSVASVTVAPAEPVLSWLGETVELSATVRDNSGNVLTGRTVVWSSLDESVSVVDSSGEATAVSNGQATIRATVDGVSGDASLTVAQVATALTITPETATIDAIGDTVRLSVVAEDEGGSPVSDASVEWRSADPTIAEVDGEGLVTALSEGSTEVIAGIGEVEEGAEVSVEQIMVGLVIQLERDSLTFLGDSVQVGAQGRDRLDNPIPGITADWASDDPEVASVGIDGWVRAEDNGTVRIHAAVDEFEADTVLVVLQRPSGLALLVEPGGAAAGQPLEVPPEVEVHDAGGSRVAIDSETQVTVSLGSGGGGLQGTLTVQVDEGVALFGDLSLEGTVGERTLAFESPDLEAVVSEPFGLGPGLPAALVLLDGDGQVGLADTELAEPLEVVVWDAWENGVPEVEISWSVTAGGGAVSEDLIESNDAGRGAVTYTLGRYAGEEEVRAEAADLASSPVEFLLTATPNGTIAGTVSLSSQNLMAASAEGTASGGLLGDSGILGTMSTLSRDPAAPPGGPRQPALGSVRQEWPAQLGSSREPPSLGQDVPARAPDFVPGELVVTLRPGAVDVPSVRAMAHVGVGEARGVSDRIRSALAPMGQMQDVAPEGEAFEIAGVSPVTLAARIRLEDSGATDAVARRLRADPRVATVEPNWIVHRGGSASWGGDAGTGAGEDLAEIGSPVRSVSSDWPVNDPLYPWQAWHYTMIGLPEAWEITTGSSAVIVAVVDDGIRFDHPDIAGNLTNDGYDFVSNDYVYAICSGGTIGRSGDGDGYDPDPTIPLDAIWDGLNQCIAGARASGGHGLHVAGTIGAVGDDGLGGSGVNQEVSIRPIRALDVIGSGTDYDIAQAVLYSAGLPADDGEGGLVPTPTRADVINLSLGGPGDAPVLREAIEAAWEAGSLLIASAGNAGTSDPRYPAAYPEVVSVSALDPWGTLAWYSSFGSTIELAAPGGGTAFGCSFGVVSTTWNFQTDGPTWDCWQGTSMAAPHVSGVAALLLANEPGLSASQLRSRLSDWAIDLGDSNSFGYGLVNARNSLTQTVGPQGDVHVVLVDADSGGEIDRIPAAPDGTFEFGELDDAEYLVFAGRDRNGDGIIGVPRRRWGGFGGSMNPAPVVVDGAGEYPASFTVGFPLEAEPNNSFADANRLVLGGYVQGVISDLSDVDVFRVSIPEAGTYTFETSPLQGACGFALEEETVLQLYDDTGAFLLEEHAIDADAWNFCSRITELLDPGDYFAAVWGKIGNRRYALHARPGD